MKPFDLSLETYDLIGMRTAAATRTPANIAIFKVVEGKAPHALAELVRSGVRASAFDEVASCLRLPKMELAKRIGIVFRTVSRKAARPEARLSSDATARILRVVRVRNLARHLFMTDAAVADWLNTPDSALYNRAPLDLLDTEYGAAEVENLLGGMLHGFCA